MKVSHIVKDLMLLPVAVFFAPRTLRRVREIRQENEDLRRRMQSVEDSIRTHIGDLQRRVQSVEDTIRGDWRSEIEGCLRDAQSASFVAQTMLKSLEANLRDLAQLRAELAKKEKK